MYTYLQVHRNCNNGAKNLVVLVKKTEKYIYKFTNTFYILYNSSGLYTKAPIWVLYNGIYSMCSYMVSLADVFYIKNKFITTLNN